MAPRTTDLGKTITYDRLGDCYLREIVLRHAHGLAPLQPSFKFATQQPFLSWAFTFIYIVANVYKKRKGEAVLAHIHRKQSKHSILIFREQHKERSLQKSAKTGLLSFKKKGNTKKLKA